MERYLRFFFVYEMVGRLICFLSFNVPLFNFTMIKFFKAFLKKNIKILFYIALFLAIKEWAELLSSNELDLSRLVLNIALAAYFWGLSVEKFVFR